MLFLASKEEPLGKAHVLGKVHVLGIALLRTRGGKLLTSNGQDLIDDTDEMTEAMEKKRLVKKLKAARDHQRAAG